MPNMVRNWIAISASPRRHKNTETLMDYYIEELEKYGRKVEKVILSEMELNICDGCRKCFEDKICCYDDEISQIINKIKDAEGLILSSPSYNYNVTPHMKVFLDRLYPLFNYKDGTFTSDLGSRGIKAIIIGACAGPDKSSMGFTIEAIKRVMDDHGIEVIVEESYFGTKRNPVMLNEEIRKEIARKVENVFL